jgi:hypothetical protein
VYVQKEAVRLRIRVSDFEYKGEWKI